MSNLRWILLLAGVAILVFLYFTGRPKAPRQHQGDAQPDSDPLGLTDHVDALGNSDAEAGHAADPWVTDEAQPQVPQQDAQYYRDNHNRYAQSDDYASAELPAEDADYATFDETRFTESLSNSMGNSMGNSPRQSTGNSPGQSTGHGVGHGMVSDSHAGQHNGDTGGYDTGGYNTGGYDTGHRGNSQNRRHNAGASEHSHLHEAEGFDPADFVRPAAAADDYPAREDMLDPEVRGLGQGSTEQSARGARSSIGEKIEAFGARLSPRRKTRVAASVPRDPDGKGESGGMEADKIISLHVVTPAGQIIPGQHLLDVFESRGYHYGDMNIFHSLHNNKTLFSIAKAVEPGNFDINDVQSFDTPGVTLILQLPGPVQGDVAFEVLISEAHELASLLGCKVLDSDRSTLGKQTVQHLRESVYEYMHRQKYFNKAPS